MDVVQSIALSMGVAWASGIRLYATVAILGILGSIGAVQLPPGLEVLTNPAVIMAASFMYAVEFFADKVPGVDTGWDTLHTFIRIPAGAILAARALGHVDPAAELVAFMLGGTLAATAHAVKAGTRVLVNVSFTEDAAVLGGIALMLYHPVAFLGLLVVFAAVTVWLLPKLLRGVRLLFARIARWFRPDAEPAPATVTAAPPPPPVALPGPRD